jgi:type 1 glutamine amidotransferase
MNGPTRPRLLAVSLAATCFLSIPALAQGTAAAPAAPRPPQAPPVPYSGNRPQSIKDGVQIQTAYTEDLVSMEDAIPTKAMVAPKQPRNLLVLCKAAGFYHSSIPLAAAAVKMMGENTGAYTATITYDAADINTANLAKYDAVFLDSTTLAFLDDPTDAAATEARKAALLAFVRSGKGLAGIHAAVDSYHTNGRDPAGLKGTWPEFNNMVGGYFKFHWVYPQKITVKIDDPKNPLNAMYHGEYVYHDETYTMAQDSFSRKNVHVLTSVDYAKMSEEDKAKEPAATKRTDGDYALSWIRKEGSGRVFMDVVGHSEHIYSMPNEMAHVLAGIQYVLGDLKADDSPSMK